jgi:hypothetical protein
MTDSERKLEETKYQTYINERNSLIAAEKESSQYFDKAILTLAAGALGLSLTFIDRIAPSPKGCTLYLLGVAWILFCASMLSTLISFLTSQLACRKQREILQDEFYSKTEPTKNTASKITNILNWIAIILFILGVAFLVTFSVVNLE